MKNNFSKLIGMKKIKIAQVAKDTGISRTTLTDMYYERVTRIDLNTLNKLCKYLEVTPNDLLILS